MHSKRSSMTDVIPLSYNDNIASFLKKRKKSFCTRHLHNLVFGQEKVIRTVIFCVMKGKPEAVQNCTVTNESTDSFQVTCQPGFNGGLPQHFTLTVYKVSTDNGELNLAANLSSALPSFTVSGLDPGSKYVGELLGHNVKGMGVPTQIHVYTLKLPEKLIPHIEDGSSNGKYSCYMPFTKLELMKMTASGEKKEGIMASKEPLKWFMVYSSIMFIPGHRQPALHFYWRYVNKEAPRLLFFSWCNRI